MITGVLEGIISGFLGLVINVYLQKNIENRSIKEILNVETKLVFQG